MPRGLLWRVKLHHALLSHLQWDGQDETVSEFIFVSRLGDMSTIRSKTDQARPPEMKREIRAEYDQMLLFPPCVGDWIGEEHPARFIGDFVESLDLRELGFAVPTSEVGGLF